jgi:hypothetical protein
MRDPLMRSPLLAVLIGILALAQPAVAVEPDAVALVRQVRERAASIKKVGSIHIKAVQHRDRTPKGQEY